MNLFDNTLRDGGNVVGHGFPAKLTESIVRGLLSAGIQDIELGNCKGLGAYEALNATEALSDRVGVMAGGRLRALGSPAELKALAGTDSFEDAFVALAAGRGAA